MRKELPLEVDQLPSPRHQARQLHQGRRGHHHQAARFAGEQVHDAPTPIRDMEYCFLLQPLISRVALRWSKIASFLPGRTDNEIKNVWNTHLKKRAASGEQRPLTDGASTSTGDRMAGAIEIPVDPTVDMFGILDDALSTSMEDSVFLETLGVRQDSLWTSPQKQSRGSVASAGTNGPSMPDVGKPEAGEAEGTRRDGQREEWLDYLEKELGLRDEVEEWDRWGETEGDLVASFLQDDIFSPYN
ncbi:unnamed protein product [Musa textilis]